MITLVRTRARVTPPHQVQPLASRYLAEQDKSLVPSPAGLKCLTLCPFLQVKGHLAGEGFSGRLIYCCVPHTRPLFLPLFPLSCYHHQAYQRW